MTLPTPDINDVGDDVPINVHPSRHVSIRCQQAPHEVPTSDVNMSGTFTEVPQNVVRVIVTFAWVDVVALLIIVVQFNLRGD